MGIGIVVGVIESKGRRMTRTLSGYTLSRAMGETPWTDEIRSFIGENDGALKKKE
jgi:hypothetical protein